MCEWGRAPSRTSRGNRTPAAADGRCLALNNTRAAAGARRATSACATAPATAASAASPPPPPTRWGPPLGRGAHRPAGRGRATELRAARALSLRAWPRAARSAGRCHPPAAVPFTTSHPVGPGVHTPLCAAPHPPFSPPQTKTHDNPKVPTMCDPFGWQECPSGASCACRLPFFFNLFCLRHDCCPVANGVGCPDNEHCVSGAWEAPDALVRRRIRGCCRRLRRWRRRRR
jgi:hypothetical protein